MIGRIQYKSKDYRVDFLKPIDISLSLHFDQENPNCFWAPAPKAWPVRADDFVGSVKEGGPVNFYNIQLNHQGKGTHTECVGHISEEQESINACLQRFHFFARLISITPKEIDGDLVITEDLLDLEEAEALLIRTLDNNDSKKAKQYSGNNPPYFTVGAIKKIIASGVRHLLVDIPSIDKEEDGGAVAGHKAYWDYPAYKERLDCTITELIYVPAAIEDGLYFLNLQISSLELDASPSKPVLYRMNEENV